ncbi:cytochrome c heme-lyase [Exophiala aquamarina CBS 119918]|uniref:Holocytochrome c-type synthase n=1 Tax=Exophiala aquamarina CBS 119918 TaxID=1182545 RepID=A0A072PKH9_9EURO|nr:cytochrome c heme-lyase [Exophiala aquamarina CBS 119918]KEF59808.1 cytochrome c heme-lyase [Exophiala aquamarina CBS 119918]
MGWFWADIPMPSVTAAAVVPLPSSHPPTQPGATPPPSCPMHNQKESAASPFIPRLDSPTSTPPSCPVKSPNHPLRNPASPETPQSSSQKAPAPSLSQPQSQSTLSKLNPLNYMPTLSNTREANSPQTISLPLEREASSIPRGDSDSNWEYPSPQQMYNAMLRKGYTDTPADAVESMVAVHNFLNEGAWAEIEEWERIFGPGLAHGWALCSKGEEGIALERAKREFLAARREALNLPTPSNPEDPSAATKPKLLRFQGRPQEPTPKARILSALGYVMPEKFGGEPPFDRHDWYVARRRPDGSVREVRYVIDYYSGGVQSTGEPVFYLDIRPALDTPTAAAERAMRWGGDIWHRATGASVREEAASRKNLEK